MPFLGKQLQPPARAGPVTDEIRWYEPEGLPVRLCGTKGLELAGFNKILADLEAEIERGISSGKIEDRVHILWLCIAEPGGRVEEGEEQLIDVCERHRIPAIVVLTKAIGPDSFEATVKELLPRAKNVIRVLAEKWGDHHPPFGLLELIPATYDLLPEATKNAFDAAQRIDLERKRGRALQAVTAAAATAAAAAAVPVPGVDAITSAIAATTTYGLGSSTQSFCAGSTGMKSECPMGRRSRPVSASFGRIGKTTIFPSFPCHRKTHEQELRPGGKGIVPNQRLGPVDISSEPDHGADQE